MSHPKISIYHKWVPDWVKLPLIIFAMFPHLMLMSLFQSNSTFTSSYFDTEPEDVQFLLSLMYGSVVVALLIFNRFFSYFRLRSYIILMSVISIGILLLLTQTKSYGFILTLRLLEGIFGLLEGACFMPLLMGQLKTPHAKTIGYLILYAIMLTGGTLTTSVVKWAIQDFSVADIFYIVIFFHICVLLITVTIFNSNRLNRKYPLFQIDYASCLFLLIAVHSGAFSIIYGRKLYWLQSNYIILAILVSLLFSVLFFIRQRFAKRPFFNFSIFKYKTVFIGVLLFFIFYIIRSGVSNVYSVMATVWKWPWEYVVNMQYYNVVGTCIGVVVSGVLLIKSVNYKIIFILSFLLFAIDYAWFTFAFTMDTTELTIGLPLALQGFCQGLLFTPLVMYITSSLPLSILGNGALIGTAVRFWSTNIGFAIIQNANAYLDKTHYSVLQQNIEMSNPIAQSYWLELVKKYSPQFDQQVAEKLATNSLNSMLSKQATLISNMEIFSTLMWVSLATCILISLIKPGRIVLDKLGVKKKFQFWGWFY